MGSYFSGGNAIKLEIDASPPHLSFWGKIQESSDKEFSIEIEGLYIQKDMQKAKCTITGETKIYVFETIIKQAKDNIIVLMTPDKDKVSVMQRRRFLRVETDMSVKCFLLDTINTNSEGNKYFPASVKDISGGGVLLNASISLPLGTLIVFELEIQNSPMVLTTRVLRNSENPNDNTRDLGCEFIGLDESDRQKIISYCTKLQLKNKRR